MDFFEVIEQRASVRSFVPCKISDTQLEKIIDAGRRAPSGLNRQPWEFILIKEKETLRKLRRVQGCIAEAEAAIAVIVNEKATSYHREDAAAAIENMLLATVALGYGSLWVEGYVRMNQKFVNQMLGVPATHTVKAILPIGKPASSPRQAPKKPLTEVLHYEQF